MSTLWTPDGERPVRKSSDPSPGPARRGADALGGRGPTSGGPAADVGEEEALAEMEALRQQLLGAPVEDVIANHAYGIFELAAVHLSGQPPQIDKARLAIDALGALVEGLEGRLGEAEPQLSEALAQLRMAFVQIRAASSAAPTAE